MKNAVAKQKLWTQEKEVNMFFAKENVHLVDMFFLPENFLIPRQESSLDEQETK